MKGKSLALRIFAMVFSALTFIVFALDHIAIIMSSGNTTESTGVSWGDWSEALDGFTEVSDKFAWFRIEQVLTILAVVLAGIIIVAAILQLFLKHKAIDLVAKIAGIALIVISLLVLVFAIIGTIATASSVDIGIVSWTQVYFPSFGVFYITIIGLVAGILGLKCGKAPKKK